MGSPPADTKTRPRIIDPATWLDEHGDYLFACALQRVSDPSVAEDLVQETLLAAVAHKGAFASRSSVRTWLVGILKHKAVDHLRASKRRETHVHEELSPEVVDRNFTRRGKWKDCKTTWGRDPSQVPLEEEFSAALADCLGKLPSRAAQALLLIERQEMGAEDLGKVLGISTTNVGVILFRARSALRRCLEENWFNRDE